MKVALVYDWLNRWGGAERVLQSLLEIWPRAEIFSSVYDRSQAKFLSRRPITSFIQKLPGAKKHAYWYYPWLPMAFETLDLSNFEMVISLSSGPAKAIVTSPETFHIHYCLSPPRYLWQAKLSPWPRLFAALSSWRQEDYYLGQRPDKIFAISKAVAARVWKYYRRPSKVIYPGINLDKFPQALENASRQDPFLVVGRLVEYKRIDLAIRAFNKTQRPLWIVGEGRMEKRLRRLAGKTIRFWGAASEAKLSWLYRHSQALIMPQEEDFGLVSLEAQASGRPVIAYRGGGARETIKEGITGLFFNEATADSLLAALSKFNSRRFKPGDCRRQAINFSKKRFLKEFKKVAEKAAEEWFLKFENVLN